MRKYFKPIVLSFLYVFSTYLAVFAVLIVLYVNNADVFKNETSQDVSPSINVLLSQYMLHILLLSGAIAIFFVVGLNMAEFKKAYNYRRVDWKNAWKPIVGGLMYLLIVSSLKSSLGMNEENNISLSHDLTSTFGGALVIAVFTPIVVELVFREANLRFMMSRGAKYWPMLIVSSICYAMTGYTNPFMVLQFFFMSLMYSAVYLKSRNVILTTLIQIIHNTMAIVFVHVFDCSNLRNIWWEELLYVLVLAYPCYRLLRSFLKDEPVIPSILWIKMKRLMVKMR